MRILEDLCEFFGIEFDEMAVAFWGQRLLAACQDAL
jgi:hypothetical protein